MMFLDHLSLCVSCVDQYMVFGLIYVSVYTELMLTCREILLPWTILRKGVGVHATILEAYARGVELGTYDKLVCFDILTNRCGFQNSHADNQAHVVVEQFDFESFVLSSNLILKVRWVWNLACRYAEFARAVVQRKLERKQPDIAYFGVIRENQRDTVTALEEQVFNAWDSGPEAPPKTRTRDAASAPNLKILIWNDGMPKFPDHVLTKFPEGSCQHAEIKKLQAELESDWPGSRSGAASNPGPSRTQSRAGGLPDFTGENPLDVGREVDLAKLSADDFNVEQLLDLLSVCFKIGMARGPNCPQVAMWGSDSQQAGVVLAFS